MTQNELDERVAVLRRLRALLEQQRDKFREYLEVLEKQQDSINSDNPDAVFIHTQIEQQVVGNIESLQKVIVPMRAMYIHGNQAEDGPEAESIGRLQNELDSLQQKVLEQNRFNRELLRVHLERLSEQIHNFNNPYKNARSVYAPQEKVATLVEINA